LDEIQDSSEVVSLPIEKPLTKDERISNTPRSEKPGLLAANYKETKQKINSVEKSL